MKWLLCAALLVMLSASQALADWKADFIKNYDSFGMDIAVEEALRNDVTPEDILKFILEQNDALKTKNSMKSLYCASIDHGVMQEVTAKLGIMGEELNIAHEESIQECGSKLSLNDPDMEQSSDAKDKGQESSALQPVSPYAPSQQ